MWNKVCLARFGDGGFLGLAETSVSKGVTTVSVKSKEALEVSKLKLLISDLHKQKRDGLEELGNIIAPHGPKGRFGPRAAP